MQKGMDKLVDLWEKPSAEEIYMIAGWRQWADAGGVSSSLPPYLVNLTGATKIGEIPSDEFYLFQIPGAHHFLRPEIKLAGGYRQSLQKKANEFFYTGNDHKGLVIFLGDEPHLNIEKYGDTFFDAVEALEVKRVGVLGGVYGAVPFQKERDVSCTYSLRRMKAELANYAIKFSDYEGGASIGSYLADKAEEREIEYFSFYSFVPAYDFTDISPMLQGLMIENDYKAWYEVMRRFNHMFGLGLDLADLQRQSTEVVVAMEAKLKELEEKLPQLSLKEYMDKVNDAFVETPFMPLDDVWERELGDLFADEDQ